MTNIKKMNLSIKGKANPVKIKHKRQNFSTLISRRDKQTSEVMYIKKNITSIRKFEKLSMLQ